MHALKSLQIQQKTEPFCSFKISESKVFQMKYQRIAKNRSACKRSKWIGQEPGPAWSTKSLAIKCKFSSLALQRVRLLANLTSYKSSNLIINSLLKSAAPCSELARPHSKKTASQATTQITSESTALNSNCKAPAKEAWIKTHPPTTTAQ